MSVAFAANTMSTEDRQEIELLRDSAARFTAQHSSGSRLRSRRDRGIEFDRKVWQSMADAGFLATAIPEEFSGLALSFDHRATLAEEFGRGLLPEPYIASAIFAASIIAASDNPELQRRLLPGMATGELVAAVAWEERADSVVGGSLATVATKTSRGIVLRGQKRFIRPGSMIDGIIVSAAGGGHVGLYWIPVGTTGLKFTTQHLADGGTSADVVLNDVRITPDAIVQTPSDGASVLAAAIDEAMVMAAAELLGVIRKSLEITLDYLRIRQQFGKPIGSFQALQHRAVNLYIQQELSEVSIKEALGALRTESPPWSRSLAASRAKARSSDAAMLVTREAVQMHGAIGFTDNHDIGLYLKRALVQSAWLGNAAQQRRRYAAVLKEQGNH
jgi:3-oxochol-4-en-24-oyl-CoA dehydrogenase